MAGVDLASWFVAKAVEAYGDRVLAVANPGAAGPQAVGRELARLIFVRAEANTGIPAPLIDRSGSGEAEHALETCIGDLLGADPDLAAAAAEVLGRYYRQQLDSGDGQALAELGDLLWWHEPQLARTAFERAAGAGNNSALIRLAQHRWVVLKDYDGALPHYQQAIASPDPGVAAEALTGLGEAHRAHGDYQAARDVLEECIATRHPDWAPRAMMMLGNMLEYQLRDYDGARAMFQAAIGTGHRSSGRKRCLCSATSCNGRVITTVRRPPTSTSRNPRLPAAGVARYANSPTSSSGEAIAAGQGRVAAGPRYRAG